MLKVFNTIKRQIFSNIRLIFPFVANYFQSVADSATNNTDHFSFIADYISFVADYISHEIMSATNGFIYFSIGAQFVSRQKQVFPMVIKLSLSENP
ncbi:hypothetical protein BH10ACI1_BH10ACI1_35050 [soil metagenome]